MLEQNIDCLVLGCTHYPYLIPVLKDILPQNITIIDSGEAVARQTKAILDRNNLLSTATHRPEYIFHTNANVEVLKDLINRNVAQVSYLDF